MSKQVIKKLETISWWEIERRKVFKWPKRYACADPITCALTIVHEVEIDKTKTYSEAAKSGR